MCVHVLCCLIKSKHSFLTFYAFSSYFGILAVNFDPDLFIFNTRNAHFQWKHLSSQAANRQINTLKTNDMDENCLLNLKQEQEFVVETPFLLLLVFFRGKQFRFFVSLLLMMSWCLMSSDVSWHIRDKLWPMPKHISINLYIHGNQKAR